MKILKVLFVAFCGLLAVGRRPCSAAEERSDLQEYFRKHYVLTEEDFDLEYSVGKATFNSEKGFCIK